MSLCGRCGREHSGPWKWVAFRMETLQVWPLFSYLAVGAFLPRKERKAEAEAHGREQRKGRTMVLEPHAYGVVLVFDPSHLDSSAEYVPPGHASKAESSAKRIQPMWRQRCNGAL